MGDLGVTKTKESVEMTISMQSRRRRLCRQCSAARRRDMSPALAWLVLPVCLLARAGVSNGVSLKSVHHGRSIRALALPPGCLYDGRWYTEGEMVSSSRSACLLCVCVRGALSCRRRACAPLPDPPPDRCQVVHRKDGCCPELQCTDGINSLDNVAKVRFAEDLSDIATPSSIAHACVEGGSVFAAGSAMRAASACEACFCLQGARRCVTPKCLPPPQGCTARAAPGACCPTRYYCRHDDVKQHDRRHDCEVNGIWVAEGDRVVTETTTANCTSCFCLRGSVRCQPLACAPPLLGCEPLLRPGECCPHQYRCQHDEGPGYHKHNNAFTTKIENRAFQSSKSTKQETTTTQIVATKNTPTTSLTNSLVATTKVKRKTNDPPPSSSQKPIENVTTQSPTTRVTTTQETTTEMATDQPDETMKVIINGTINCTAEISSTSLPRNISFEDSVKAAMDVQPRVPIVNIENLDHTYSPNDIITDRNINVFDENESFTINVTSSLMTNTSLSTKPPLVTVSKPGIVADVPNTSKKTKGDYDYDYTEPTLPPSLPNLKIIPFVAADAVVDEKAPKETLTYPLLEREDKFPVYYPNVNQKESQYASRREGVYDPTQYPVFISNKNTQYPSLTHDMASGFASHNDLEYTVGASLGNRVSEVKEVTKPPTTSTTFSVEMPAVNLFSPPVETEGGFMPKDPGIIDDYYAVYANTPPAPAVPHLTTSMQLDIVKGECVSPDGQRVAEGENAVVGCTRCDCTWGRLLCVPIDCPTPEGCHRAPVIQANDECCGELICEEVTKTSPVASTTVEKSNKNNTVVKTENISLTLKVDTPSYNTTIINMTLPSIKVEDKVQIGSKNPINVQNNVHKTSNVSMSTTTNISETNLTLTTEATSEKSNQTLNHSQEYDEDEDDEGFSFGSVLKLLLSDNYETTTVATIKPTVKPVPTKPIATTTRRPSKPTLVPFIPLPPGPLIPPPNKVPINRIDHLLLGETSAIKTTRQPVTMRPIVKTTQAPTKIPEVKVQIDQVKEAPSPPNLGIGAGLLKLAGCNIYGRMYRVGRIIAELSTPCQECWCTELGVQCKPLKC
ncbi:hypothetical protein O3G_MSEX010199 [Manduca sexta]|uniref:VWFC domain-containing protein n=2 Tax=Manduca sexta TaxID=7130 RepID=A0A921ZFZ4_MANSE|nr:hypothetical protein O3G_MSEX010199 [Manduca sexta]